MWNIDVRASYCSFPCILILMLLSSRLVFLLPGPRLFDRDRDAPQHRPRRDASMNVDGPAHSNPRITCILLQKTPYSVLCIHPEEGIGSTYKSILVHVVSHAPCNYNALPICRSAQRYTRESQDMQHHQQQHRRYV